MPTVTEKRYWILGNNKYIGVETSVAEDTYKLQQFALQHGLKHFELVRTMSAHSGIEQTN